MAFETRSLIVKIPAMIALVLPPIFVITRLWIRLAMTRSFGVDDWMILASVVFIPFHFFSLSHSLHRGFLRVVRAKLLTLWLDIIHYNVSCTSGW